MALARKNVDATEGPLFSKMIVFVIPLMLTNLIQQLYSMADSIVVGQFSGDPNALAAIGSAASLIALLTSFVTGFSSGAGVTVSNAFGARDAEALSRSVHTSYFVAAIAGLLVSAVSFAVSRPLLMLLGTKAELMDAALLYARILILGIPAVSVYNFSAASLRAVGDSRTPFYTLTATGILNVLFNLVFVIGFGMSVDGVAIATIIAQYLSATVVTLALALRRGEAYRLRLSQLKAHRQTLVRILRLGLPAAIQASLFGITNLFLIAALNSFPTPVLTARTIAASIDALLSTVVSTYVTVTMTFSGQNYGARNYSRIKLSLLYSFVQVLVLSIGGGSLIIAFSEPIIRIYVSASDPNIVEVIEAAKTIMLIMLASYPIGFVNDNMTGYLRGLGRSVLPLIVAIMGTCLFRIVWILLVFPYFGTLEALYILYPISWSICALGNAVMCIITMKKIKAELSEALPNGKTS